MSETGRKSVANKFGPAATNLSNRLPPRDTAEEQPTQPKDSAVIQADTAEAKPEVPTPAYLDQAEEPHPETSTTTMQINVHLLPHVIALVDHARSGRSNANIVLDALDQATNLTSLVDHHRGQPTPTSSTSRFRRTGTTRSRSGSSPRRPWTFRLSRDNVNVLDQLVRETGATSRSELVEAALAAAHC